MTRILAFFGALALLAAPLARPAAAASPTQITVTGEGTATAMPDMATESFTISTNSDTAAAAASDNNARYERLLKALEGLGIAKSDIRTTSYNVNYSPPPQPEPGTPVQPVRERYGYFVYRGISVTLHKLDLASKAVDAAVASGVTDIGGVTFGIAQRGGQQKQALSMAVRDARTQAEAMAAAAGLHIVRVRAMQQGFAAAPMPMLKMAAMQGAAPSPATQIEPGSVETRATVTITYDAQ
jgi:uncharacterized protein YggE